MTSTADERYENARLYRDFLAERADLTDRILRLEQSSLAIRNADRRIALDERRSEIHRQLEEIGRQIGKSRMDVLQDVVMGELEGSRSIPGLRPTDLFPDDYKKAVDDGMYEGVLLVFDLDTYKYDWRTEQTVKAKNSEKYKSWLEEQVDRLVEKISTQFKGYDIAVREVERDWSGFAHVDRVVMNGIFVPKELIREVVSFIRRDNNWVTEQELKEHREEIKEINFGLTIEKHGHANEKLEEQIELMVKRLKSETGIDMSQDDLRKQFTNIVLGINVDERDLNKRPGEKDGELYSDSYASANFQLEDKDGERFLAMQFHGFGNEISVAERPMGLFFEKIKSLSDHSGEVLAEKQREIDLEQEEWEGEQIERRLSRGESWK